MLITLLQRPGKVDAKEFTATLEESLSRLRGELSASTRLVGFSANGWAEVEIDGEDAEVVTEIISRELDRAQTDLNRIQLQDSYYGIVDSVGADLSVDIGIEKPSPLSVRLNLNGLRAQLCDGKPLSGNEIAGLYCLHSGSRLSVRITRLERDTSMLEAWLADSQIKLFSHWITSRLERVQVFDCTRPSLENAIRRANLERDIISVEPSTLTSHSVVCKLGTDAIGLIPKLGSKLRKSELEPFLPKRILKRCRPW
jgi:hypothetical protein